MTAILFFVAVGILIGGALVAPLAFHAGRRMGRAERLDPRLARAVYGLQRIGARQIAAERARVLPESAFIDAAVNRAHSGEPSRCDRG